MSQVDKDAAPSPQDLSRREFLGAVTVGAAAVTAGVPIVTGKAFAGPANGIDLCYMNATDLAAAIRAKDLSAVEVMNAYLDRIAEVNPAVNAVVSMVDREVAIGMAEQADAELAAGKKVGPLHGMPWAVKDMDETKSIRTTLGSRIFKDYMPDKDSLMVSRLRASGALIIGKSNCPEFSAGSHTFNDVFGITRNPYNLALTSGGSTGGGCAAVASGMLPLADGNDTGGSLRNPGSWNNVVAMRTSSGRIPFEFPMSFMVRLPAIGPVGRNVNDAAYLLAAMAGPHPLEPLSIFEDPAIFAQPLDRDFKGTMVAWTPDLGYLPVEPAVVDATAKAIPVLESIGCEVEDDHPDMTGTFETHKTLRGVLTAMASEAFYPAKKDLIKATMIWDIEGGRKLGVFDIGHAEQQRTRIYNNVIAFLQKYQFLVLPTTQVVPFPVETEYPTEINGVQMRTYMEWMEICYAISLTGLPAISVPCGFTEAGMPVGLQIVGRKNDDLGVLQLAYAFEQAAQVAKPRVPVL